MPTSLCTYIMTNDSGLAPNPFWGYCTLAICTPNHMGVRPREGEFWIAGFSDKKSGNKLIYAMRVDEYVDFNSYYSDPRFSRKKPNVRGSWRQIVGDNMYYLDDSGVWRQHRTVFHTEENQRKQDLKHPRVYVSNYFFYFGERAVSATGFRSLIPSSWGVRIFSEETVVVPFVEWLQHDFPSGVIGLPKNRRRHDCL